MAEKPEDPVLDFPLTWTIERFDDCSEPDNDIENIKISLLPITDEEKQKALHNVKMIPKKIFYGKKNACECAVGKIVEPCDCKEYEEREKKIAKKKRYVSKKRNKKVVKGRER
ncbi:hypothetical protein NPIL_494921 [Nephila pilipes]|uniref:Uncharacterized protein n=1 Tax=Nephila pilipes TaxID=299642 RepID=A0A8X6QY86_NEPPI|nr:hypothetical protein NPIL_494921 [Nephila pilipes]